MQREILFRAKSRISNKWIYGYVGYHKFKEEWIICDADNLDNYIAIPGTVTQYTGFENKIGDRLFEGDIVTDGDKNYIISFYKGSFILNEINKAYYQNFINCYMDYIKELKVIGNRFDNPELLD